MESLQRIYGISFPDNKLMKEWKVFQEEAAKRDHRKIGLFYIPVYKYHIFMYHLFLFHPISVSLTHFFSLYLHTILLS